MKRNRSASSDPVSASRKRAKGLVDKCSDIFKYIKKNNEQIAALEADNEKALTRCGIIKKDLDKEIERYAQSLCLEQTEAVCAAFPREVRDMIWGNLFWDSARDSKHKCPIAITDLDEARYPKTCARHGGGRPKQNVEPHKIIFKHWHWLHPEFVGEEAAAEITEAFYKGNIFEVNNCVDLDTFLNDKSLGGGIQPINCIKGLNISIHDHHFSEEDELDEKACCPNLELYTAEGLQKILRQLHGVKYPDGFKLTVVLYASIHSLRAEAIVAAMHPVLKELRDVGFKMRIQMKRVRGVPQHSLDVTSIFKAKEEDFMEALHKCREAQLKQEEDAEEDDYDDYDDYGGYYDDGLDFYDYHGYDDFDFNPMDMFAGHFLYDLEDGEDSDSEEDSDDQEYDDSEDEDGFDGSFVAPGGGPVARHTT